MHITITIGSHESNILKLPQQYLHLFQSLIYKLLPSPYAEFLHDRGYVVDGRSMKLFAMSWPISCKLPLINEKQISFFLPLKIVVSTPVDSTMNGIASGALSNECFHIGNNVVICEKIEACAMSAEGDSVTVKTLSPITCYSTMYRPDGRKYTVYFSPYDKDFSESVHNNLLRKFKALYPESTLPEGKVQICPVGRPAEHIARFSDQNSFPIKGWSGNFALNGPKELLQTALDCGIGAKNSGGWGCVEIFKKE